MMDRNTCFTTLAAAALLTLGACGDAGEEEIADANLAVAGGAPDAVILYPAGTEASFETNALRGEVERLQREGGMQNMAGQAGTQPAGQAGGANDANMQGGAAGTSGSMDGNQSASAGTGTSGTGTSGTGTGGAGTSGTAASGGTNAGMNAGPAAGMSAGQGGGAAGMSGLDRDSDGRLSPAEYAIHALPSETAARQGATNDEKPPFVSDEALNRVVTEFRRLDKNGDFFLSMDEFNPATR